MPAIPIISLAVSVVGTGASILATSKANKYAKQSAAYQQQQDNLKNARQRVQAVRAARLSSGVVAQAGANQGVSESSATLGGFGSIQSQLDSNLSFLDRGATLSDQANIASVKASSARVSSQNFSAIAGLGVDIFKSGGSVFKSKGS